MRLILEDGACVIPGGACVWVGAGMPSNHGIIDRFGLKGTSEIIYFQQPHHAKGLFY